LNRVLGFTPPIEHVADALFSAVYDEDPLVTELVLGAPLAEHTQRLREHYADPRWTWRR
jgi:hypothetical protein